MRRVIGLVVVGVIVVAIAWGLANLSGHVSASIGAFRVETSASVAVLALIVAFILGVIVLRILVWLFTLPWSGSAWRRRMQVRNGERAITQVLVALAAGEDRVARREARRVRDLLGDSPQTLLLAAEAGRMGNREDEAEAAYRALTKRPDGKFLGFRGLLRQAIERRDWTSASAFAREAEAALPGTAWLRQQRAELAVHNDAWAEAAELCDQPRQRAVYLVAAAEGESDSSKALSHAKLAWRIDPGFTPAVLAYARRLRRAGKERRALGALAEAWRKAPNPALAEMALAKAPNPLARYEAAKRLVVPNPTHPESRLLVARTAIEAGKLTEAHQAIDAARTEGMNQRRLWLLIAELAEIEKGGTEEGQAAQRDALRHAAIADPDPAWHCANCRAVSLAWTPRCPSCGSAGTLTWRADSPVLTLPGVVAGDAAAVPSV
ncbi:heme biosynthesis HemY N-terminal domain-containing protein [Rhodopila sp.]|jgi:HemY protein|uniref:heme biosynthesis HemY N-terminal domain-containing protein n=1 Tax=Rhodopila sp. TaxID=2480087 RepID=UPI002B754ABC|nr:heme biosynthesis HemY N-terminal domain-containing protein [Rhodopila sp.]HVZ09401.1 heme biosynthesis HemY N-terminal domain-containing protein [Rhodopila sp.]